MAETGSWRAEGDRSAAHHLAGRTGTSVVQAAAAIETARRLEALPDTAAAARRGRIHQRRSLRSYTDAEGEWHLHCRNNPEVGAKVMAALELFRDEIFRQARSEGRHEPPEAYAADALTEMARCSGEGNRRAGDRGRQRQLHSSDG